MAKKKSTVGVVEVTPMHLTWALLDSGECVMGTAGNSFVTFHCAADAAEYLRGIATKVEKAAKRS